MVKVKHFKELFPLSRACMLNLLGYFLGGKIPFGRNISAQNCDFFTVGQTKLQIQSCYQMNKCISHWGYKNQLTITVILSGNQQCSTGSATCYPQCFDLGNRLIDGSETRLHYAQESTGITAHTPHERQLLVSGRRLRVQKWSTHNNVVSSFLIQDGTGMFLHQFFIRW